jgi:hypothetical protein
MDALLSELENQLEPLYLAMMIEVVCTMIFGADGVAVVVKRPAFGLLQ